MNILLLGYGKMGKTIEEIAKKKNHNIVLAIDQYNYDDLKEITPGSIQLAFEFTQPESAFNNLTFCIDNNIAVVCGTTGWSDRRKELEDYCKQKGGSVFIASNFSIGVNLFFHFNEMIARIMKEYPDYGISMEEIHHTEKKDAPSGTAITLAERVLAEYPSKKTFVNWPSENQDELSIISKRIPNVPGTHSVTYKSSIDSIELIHTAFSREGFASGAVLAGEWLVGKKGVFGMKDLLNF